MEKIVNMALVDDEADVGVIYKTKLRKEIKSGALALFFFLSGQELLDFLAKNSSKIEIIILVSDIAMPNMDGLTLAERVKKEYPTIDLYISSAFDRDYYRERAQSLGVKGFLPKPVDFDLLKKLISEKYT